MQDCPILVTTVKYLNPIFSFIFDGIESNVDIIIVLSQSNNLSRANIIDFGSSSCRTQMRILYRNAKNDRQSRSGIILHDVNNYSRLRPRARKRGRQVGGSSPLLKLPGQAPLLPPPIFMTQNLSSSERAAYGRRTHWLMEGHHCLW